MDYSSPSQQPEVSPNNRMESLCAIESLLARIKPSLADHTCPNDSPCGHHDDEGLGKSAVFCRVFKLGCAHPLTEGSETELSSDTLVTCIQALGEIGAISPAELRGYLYRYSQTHRVLWDIDTGRRSTVFAIHNCAVRDGITTEQGFREALAPYQPALDARYRPIQHAAILDRLAIVIELQAHILGAKRKIELMHSPN